jgi:hypothetical protein
MKTRRAGKGIILGVMLGVVSVLASTATTWASTRVGNMELQMWYSTRNTFHTNGGDHLDWVQWRNEIFGWLVYENIIKSGKVFDQFEVPLIKNATINARYRFRADPVYSIRKHFSKLYTDEEKESFLIPENGFRDLFADLDFGDVGPGGLSARIGYQQIVWGESDLFRSIDVINPLRIDQNQGAGEKFDEFRTPLLALKFLYNIGNVGQYFSNVAIEPFLTPRYRTGSSDLILEGGFRLSRKITGCLDKNDREVPYDPVTCARLRSSNGERVFVNKRPGWLGDRRMKHPWSIFVAGDNARNASVDYACVDAHLCSPDVPGDRQSLWVNLNKGQERHVLNGWGRYAGGTRITGTSVWGVDWSLNYAYIYTGETGSFDINGIFDASGPFAGKINPNRVYGDRGILSGLDGKTAAPAGTFEEGLRRCVADSGRNHETKGPSKANSIDGVPPLRGHKAGATLLVGGDLFGYNNPARFRSNNSRGALADDGTPLPGRHQATRSDITFCAPAKHDFLRSHVSGFTLTYNDFDYTGMVFRLEQSYSTKEPIRFAAPGFGPNASLGVKPFVIKDDIDKTTGVWRSMLGFDLLHSYKFFSYIPGLHRSFSEQAWFLSGQWLMENTWNNIANNFCQNVDNIGNGLTKEEAAARTATGKKTYSNPRCRRYRWNHLFTLGFANQGLFGSRLETRNAVAFEPRDKQYLLYSQWWWRNVLGYNNIELSAGVAWYPGSGHGESWSGIQHFADRDQFWAEFKYYIL